MFCVDLFGSLVVVFTMDCGCVVMFACFELDVMLIVLWFFVLCYFK